MRRNSNHSLVRLLLAAILILHLMIGGVTASVLIAFQYRSSRRALVSYTEKMGQSFSPGLSDAVWVYNRDFIISNVKGIALNENVRAVTVLDESGSVLYAHCRESEGRLAQFLPPMAVLEFPLSVESRKGARIEVGTLRIQPGTKVLANDLMAGLSHILLFTLLSFLALGFGVMLLGHRYLTGPLSQLARSIHRVDIGVSRSVSNIEPRAMRGEIGSVLDVVNGLLERMVDLTSRNREINQNLEALVAERTQELERQNQKLIVARETAEKAVEARNRFFSIISHDLRGPVGSLATVLNEMIDSPEQVNEELFGVLKKSSRTTHQLLENLLTWFRQQDGMISANPVSFPVDSMVSECVEGVVGEAERKHIRMLRAEPLSGTAYADPQMIQTVIRNLLMNALKYTPAKGFVRIESRVVGGLVEVCVVDSGAGVPDDVREKLFRDGERVKSVPGTEQESGSGLGLMFCHEFVKKNGGEMGVESEPVTGCRFWFTLPQAELN